MFKLVIQDDEGKTTVVPLIRDEITIGRKEGNTIRLTERNVSRRHARIMRNNGEVHIEDLGSYNGIRVNNARIAEKVSLRVSDQVQIGDYKLYLKAEGIEQADEARTMPIERIDGHVEAVVGGSQTPTMPLGIPAQGTVPPPVSALVGDPNRTQVAIADTDPAGRPIASAVSPAAVPASAAYGKLVVLSSNFAGKELELTRPQMIIGRTDENDLVINHRSISRNHAKVVRDRDTGRYTISDLQSSNGVRVNGQDYSQVELRRADVVDLGHVRLRFVEPGEDFVFSAAAITDVPDVGGSKRGLLVAVVLGIVVLGAVGVYMLTRNKEEPVQQGGPGPGPGTGSGSDQIAGPGSGTGASNDPGPGSAAVAVATVPPDAAPAVVVPVEVGSDTCAKVQGERKWIDLKECAATITDKAKSKELAELAASELKAEMITNDIGNLAKKGKLKEAVAQLKKIPDTSVYRREAQDTYDNAAGEAEDELNKKYAAAVADRNCQQAKALIKEANANGVSTTGASATCTPAQVATNPKTNPTNPKTNPTNGSNDNPSAVKNPTPVEVRPEATVCDAAASKKKGEDYLAGGMDMAALAQFEGSLRCKPDAGVVKLAYMASCRAKSTAKAKLYFNKIPAAQQGQLLQICVRAGVDPQ